MIYPQPVRRHYHPKYSLITLAPVSYLRSLVVRAVHRHRTGVGSIPAGGPIVDEFFSTVPAHINPIENLSTSTEVPQIIMIYPQPVRRHYHPKYSLITLAPVSYLRSLVVRAVHRHRTGVGSIPAGGPIVDEFFSTVPG